jgi:phage major head subunit gpT-like protein
MNSKEWPRFVLPIVRKEWQEQMAAVVSPLSPYFGISGAISSVEYSQGMGAFGLVPEYNSASAEGAPAAIEYDNFNPLYETTFTHKEYAKGVAIERKLMDDNRTGQIKRKAQSLGFSFGTTVATHMSSVLNNAFSASYLGADAVALCSNSHPVNKNSSDVFDNLGTTALSYDAVVATLIAGQNMDNDRGNPMPIVYDTLYVPTALQGTAFEIIKALSKPGGANNDANALNYISGAPLNVVVDPYLSDANNWFMVSKPMANMHMLWFWRVRPEIALDPSSDYNLVAKYRGYMRYSFGWDDARFIFGHEVT